MKRKDSISMKSYLIEIQKYNEYMNWKKDKRKEYFKEYEKKEGRKERIINRKLSIKQAKIESQRKLDLMILELIKERKTIKEIIEIYPIPIYRITMLRKQINKPL